MCIVIRDQSFGQESGRSKDECGRGVPGSRGNGWRLEGGQVRWATARQREETGLPFSVLAMVVES